MDSHTSDDERNLLIARRLLEAGSSDVHSPEAGRVDARVPVDELLRLIALFSQTRWGYLSAITGLDLGPEAGKMEVLYHFCTGSVTATLRVSLGRDEPQVPSVCELIPSAGFFERELSEMFGITVLGTPDPSRLFLPDEWPQGQYPLRKDFQHA